MNGGIAPVGGPAGPLGPPASAPSGSGFAAALAAARAGQARPPELRLSAHAAERLRQAGLGAAGPGWERVRAAVEAAAAKGARQTLVIWPPCSLVVAVPQRVVITALGADRLGAGAQVVTGIDSAVFVPGAQGLDIRPGRGDPGSRND